MNRQEAKEHIRTLLAEYLENQTTKKGKQYICPLCGSGTGNNNNYTPALTVNGEKWNCFSCNNGGDIFNLIALQNSLDVTKDFYKVLDIAAAALNISIDNAHTTDHTSYTHTKHNTEKPQQSGTNDSKTEQKKTIAAF